MNTDLPALPEPSLLPCPFCGHTTPYFERMGTPRQSCIVACGDCGARHESSDEGTRSGSSWNTRAALAAQQPNAPSDAVPAPLTRTDIARVYREVYGSPRMGSTEEEFARRIERATAEALAAQQPAAVPAGWKPVPLEPTQEMEDAAMRETTACDEDFRDEDARIDFRVGYRAALAAAPAVQPTEAKEQPAEAVAPSTWSNYVADMIGAYLKWPVGDARIVAVAGIIERRRKFDPERAAPTAAPSAQPVAVPSNLLKAARRMESAFDWFVGRSAFTQTKHLKGIEHSSRVRKEVYDAHDELRSALAAAPSAPQPSGHCTRGDGCVCGGDTVAVRAACRHWETETKGDAA